MLICPSGSRCFRLYSGWKFDLYSLVSRCIPAFVPVVFGGLGGWGRPFLLGWGWGCLVVCFNFVSNLMLGIKGGVPPLSPLMPGWICGVEERAGLQQQRDSVCSDSNRRVNQPHEPQLCWFGRSAYSRLLKLDFQVV